jgi:hypothetical protein
VQCSQQFPNLVTNYTQLVKQIHICVDKFRKTGSVSRKPGSGPRRKKNADCIAVVQRRMEKINCETVTRGSVICGNMPQYIKKRSAIICIEN